MQFVFRIWDKLCGGSCKILVFVVTVLLNNQRHRLLKCIDLISVLQVIKNVSEFAYSITLFYAFFFLN